MRGRAVQLALVFAGDLDHAPDFRRSAARRNRQKKSSRAKA
jgi:hypothetical protein